jgi:hypothetical protein
MKKTTARATPSFIKVGSLVQAQLPSKKSVRNYRVDALALDEFSGVRDFVISLREMWRKDSDRTWVISKRASQFKLSSLIRLSEVLTTAPEAGSKRPTKI